MVTYDFYRNTYLGDSIQEQDFSRLAKRAGEVLSRYKRIYKVTTPDTSAESMALCAMADALCYFEAVQNGQGGPVNSASIGSVSVSYGASGGVDTSTKAQAKELYRCASLYLDIYRGCC